jgi:hypothetical protein
MLLNEHGPIQGFHYSFIQMMPALIDHLGSFLCWPTRHLRLSLALPTMPMMLAPFDYLGGFAHCRPIHYLH